MEKDKINLKAGDVLSYSAGTSSNSPWGFRTIIPNTNSVANTILQNVPNFYELLEPAPILINCYPAPPAQSPWAILIDTYLSPKTAFRALALAAERKSAVVLAGQPLFLADLIYRAKAMNFSLPNSIVFACGGYPLPLSLERVLKIESDKMGCKKLIFLEFYGVAEIDQQLLVSFSRNQSGQAVYIPRGPEITVSLTTDGAILTFKHPTSGYVIAQGLSEDIFQEYDKGFTIHPNRISKIVAQLIDSWGLMEWERRTGYLALNNGKIIAQLRDGLVPQDVNECEYWCFSKEHQLNWLKKPNWNL